MTTDARACRHQILALLRAARTTDQLMRDLGMLDPEVSVVIGVDQAVWDEFTDEDGPAKEYPTFLSRHLSSSPDIGFEITAFKDDDDG